MDTFNVELSFKPSKKIASGNLLSTLRDKLKCLGTNVQILSITSENGLPTIDINIDLYGSLKVVGGLSFKESTGKKTTTIVVDEGASHLLFELDNSNKKAYFHGALTGLENDRFFNTRKNGVFSYYRRTYRRLKDADLFKLVDQSAVYTYDTAEKQESPRKKSLYKV